MPIVGGLDIHRKQITFDYLDTVTGEVKRGPIAPADRAHVRAWLARFAGCGDVAFAVEGCAGWRYVAEELAAAGIAAHLGEPAGTAALRGRKRHAKTDKTDARHLRTLLAEGRLPECWIPPAQILEYRALERRRRAEAALVTVVATSYLLGVSTRRMEKLVATLHRPAVQEPGQRDGPGPGSAGGRVPDPAAGRWPVYLRSCRRAGAEGPRGR